MVLSWDLHIHLRILIYHQEVKEQVMAVDAVNESHNENKCAQNYLTDFKQNGFSTETIL